MEIYTKIIIATLVAFLVRDYFVFCKAKDIMRREYIKITPKQYLKLWFGFKFKGKFIS